VSRDALSGIEAAAHAQDDQDALALIGEVRAAARRMDAARNLVAAVVKAGHGAEGNSKCRACAALGAWKAAGGALPEAAVPSAVPSRARRNRGKP
jgi:hypothetical protein